jgi:hypothetical protein
MRRSPLRFATAVAALGSVLAGLWGAGIGIVPAAAAPEHPRKARAIATPNRQGERPGFMRAGPEAAFRYEPGFTRPLAASPTTRIAFMPNPLVSAEYRATPEYEYLYHRSFTAAAAPPPPPSRYAGDNGYLLRRSFGSGAIAWAYRWSNCTPPMVSQAMSSITLGAGADTPRGGRGRDRKAEDVLKPSSILAGLEPGGVAGGFDLGREFRLSPWGASDPACRP